MRRLVLRRRMTAAKMKYGHSEARLSTLHDKFFSKLFGLHVAPAFCKNIMHTPRSPKLKKKKPYHQGLT